MRTYSCMYACMYVCMYECTNTKCYRPVLTLRSIISKMQQAFPTSLYVCVCACVCVSVHVYIDVYVSRSDVEEHHLQDAASFVCVCVCVCVWMCTYMCMSLVLMLRSVISKMQQALCVYVYVCECVHTCVCLSFWRWEISFPRCSKPSSLPCTCVHAFVCACVYACVCLCVYAVPMCMCVCYIATHNKAYFPFLSVYMYVYVFQCVCICMPRSSAHVWCSKSSRLPSMYVSTHVCVYALFTSEILSNDAWTTYIHTIHTCACTHETLFPDGCFTIWVLTQYPKYAYICMYAYKYV